jgi:ABC-type hemin transport system ATPase subunit
VQTALRQVNADQLAAVPVGVMSGGELQRVRIAQALAAILCCCCATSRCSTSTPPTRGWCPR